MKVEIAYVHIMPLRIRELHKISPEKTALLLWS